MVFSEVIKMGRTQLQDAVPMTLGQEFEAFRVTVKEPLITLNIFQSLKMLIRAIRALAHRCVSGITANEEHCRSLVENSNGTLFSPPLEGQFNSSKNTVVQNTPKLIIRAACMVVSHHK